MIRPPARGPIAWSVRAYAALLLIYPLAFREEFGESMTQVFTDLARDSFRRSGLTGLAALWIQIAIDVVVSLASAYVHEGRTSMYRVVVVAGILYLSLLALAAGYGAIRFGEFYQPPAFTRLASPESVNENALLAAHAQALEGEFGRYRAFAFAAGLTLAVLLGIASALFGLWQKSVLHGAGAFVTGAVLTVAVFELMPAIWFPFDRYPVGALWVMGGAFPLACVVWLVVTLSGRTLNFELRTTK